MPIALGLAAIPAVFAWLSGRSSNLKADCPIRAEAWQQRQARLVGITAATCILLLWFELEGSRVAALLAPLLAIIADVPVRRAVLGEQAPVLVRLAHVLRTTVALPGFMITAATLPLILGSSASWGWATAAFALLLLWLVGGGGLRRWLLWARLPEDRGFEAIVEASRAPPPVQLWVIGDARTQWPASFALPGVARSDILVGQTLVDRLEQRHLHAVLAHELAHLEAWPPSRVWRSALLDLTLAGGAAFLRPLAGMVAPEFAASASLLWWFFVMGLFGFLAARRQDEESQADLRAAELVGDREAVAEAVERAYELALLPREMGGETSSHPSLRQRLMRLRGESKDPEPKLAIEPGPDGAKVRPLLALEPVVAAGLVLLSAALAFSIGSTPLAFSALFAPGPATFAAAGASVLATAALGTGAGLSDLYGARVLVAVWAVAALAFAALTVSSGPRRPGSPGFTRQLGLILALCGLPVVLAGIIAAIAAQEGLWASDLAFELRWSVSGLVGAAAALIVHRRLGAAMVALLAAGAATAFAVSGALFSVPSMKESTAPARRMHAFTARGVWPDPIRMDPTGSRVALRQSDDSGFQLLRTDGSSTAVAAKDLWLPGADRVLTLSEDGARIELFLDIGGRLERQSTAAIEPFVRARFQATGDPNLLSVIEIRKPANELGTKARILDVDSTTGAVGDLRSFSAPSGFTTSGAISGTAGTFLLSVPIKAVDHWLGSMLFAWPQLHPRMVLFAAGAGTPVLVGRNLRCHPGSQGRVKCMVDQSNGTVFFAVSADGAAPIFWLPSHEETPWMSHTWIFAPDRAAIDRGDGRILYADLETGVATALILPELADHHESSPWWLALTPHVVARATMVGDTVYVDVYERPRAL